MNKTTTNEILKSTTIYYEDCVIELSKLGTGSYLISNGCQVLGLEKNYNDAWYTYQRKVKAFKAKRTRELNKQIKYVSENADSVNVHCVIDVFKNRFHIPAEQTIWMFETRGIKFNY